MSLTIDQHRPQPLPSPPFRANRWCMRLVLPARLHEPSRLSFLLKGSGKNAAWAKAARRVPEPWSKICKDLQGKFRAKRGPGTEIPPCAEEKPSKATDARHRCRTRCRKAPRIFGQVFGHLGIQRPPLLLTCKDHRFCMFLACLTCTWPRECFTCSMNGRAMIMNSTQSTTTVWAAYLDVRAEDGCVVQVLGSPDKRC